MVVQYLQCFGAGLLISLSGSLPLGNLNVSAMQIAAKDTVNKALWFAIGVTLIEMVYLKVTLGVVDVLAGYERLFYFFRIISIVLLIVMALGSFFVARSSDAGHIVLDGKRSKFVLGLLMSTLNPMQIPFWFGWAVYLLSHAVLVPISGAYNIFTVGAGAGTFIALLVFIFAGRKFSGFMLRNHKAVNISMGFLFVIMAVYQAIHFF